VRIVVDGNHITPNLLQLRKNYEPPDSRFLANRSCLGVLSRPSGDQSRHRRSAPVEEILPPSVRAWTRQITSFPATDEISSPGRHSAVPENLRRNFVMTIGTVKFFNTSKGFGFIAPEGGGKDVFVHATAVEAAGMRSLTEGQKVSFDIVPDARGAKAANLKSA
jgi:CspA family cold shock protein